VPRLLARLVPPLSAVVLLAVLPAGAGAIVAGSPADRADYPYYTVVGGGTHCGGALISPTRVLTAGHCSVVTDLARTVTVGPHDEPRTITKIAQHPEYVKWEEGPGGGFGLAPADLMILELDQPITDIAPVRLATPADHLTANGQRVTIIGRGVPVNGQEPRDMIFRSAQEVIVPTARCGDTIGGAFQQSWSLCALDPRAPADPYAKGTFVSTCHGDSGGPLIAFKGGVPYDLGTVSGGAECGSAQGDVYGNAVRGRDFALDPHPVWTPYTAHRPKLEGSRRVGRTLRCAVPWITRPKTTIYEFDLVDGHGQVADTLYSGRRGSYRVRAKARGKRLICNANGFSAGGNQFTRYSKPVRIARR
jgi:hypothetical protein